MTPDPATRFATPQTGGAPQDQKAEKSGAEQNKETSADFRNHLDNSSKIQPTHAPTHVQKIDQTKQVNSTNQVNTVESTEKVNRGTIPDKQNLGGQDMFGQFDKIRGEFDAFLKRSGELDKAVADGKLKIGDPKVMQQHREEMRMLLHFQSEMQGTAMKVEIASKVVEHGTSGVKTVLSTQA